MWGALADRHDMLRLLLGALGKKQDEYKPPSETLSEYLAGLDRPTDMEDRRAARRLEVTRFIAEATRGEG